MTLTEAIELADEARSYTQKEGSASQACAVLLTEINRQRLELQDLSHKLDECNIRRHYLEIQVASASMDRAP